MRNMEIKCRIEVECGSRREAEILNRALRVDNEGYISSSVAGKVLVAEVEENNAMSLLHTINDFLSCLQLAVEGMKRLKGI